MQKKIRVLVIDDSHFVRTMLTEILTCDDIEVIDTANDPYEAREKIKELNPDVLTLDVEMPKMNGVTFLKNLMRLRPMPVVMVSTLTEEGAPTTLESLELGAVDYFAKPKQNLMENLPLYTDQLREKVRVASKANIVATSVKKHSVGKNIGKKDIQYRPNILVAIGASTGGTEALKEVISNLPADFPPVVITQHIPPVFSSSFAKRVDQCSQMRVFEAHDGMKIKQGCVYIAPGDQHLVLKKVNYDLFCQLLDTPPVNRHRPAVDVLFDSVAELKGRHAIGCILTGMGNDGAKGLLKMKEAGAITLVQDEKTSVVWGMPRVAYEMGAADKVLPLNKIADQIIHFSALPKKA
nr:chemotaxis response regulator protein-glutamate methylesterase [Algicola sagamiensis]